MTASWYVDKKRTLPSNQREIWTICISTESDLVKEKEPSTEGETCFDVVNEPLRQILNTFMPSRLWTKSDSSAQFLLENSTTLPFLSHIFLPWRAALAAEAEGLVDGALLRPPLDLTLL